MAYVLIVDDDEDFAFAAAKELEEAGHEAKIELETSAAMEDMKQRRPDVVVLDVMFPESPSEGFEVARAMHDDEQLKDIPILMLTAVNATYPLGFSSRDIDQTWLPVSDFLEKPVDFDVLRQKVDALAAAGPQAAPSDSES